MTTFGNGNSEFDFMSLLGQLVAAIPEYAAKSVSVNQEDGGADMVVWADGEPTIVEAKSDTPKTPERLQAVVTQLQQTAKAWRRNIESTRQPRLVLAVPGIPPTAVPRSF